MEAEIAIIGGTGLADPGLLEGGRLIRLDTPYGPPSAEVAVGTFCGRQVAVLPRHGRPHAIPPHRINYRANIHALKMLGVRRILSPCAVGSLQEGIRPGDIVLPDQFLDLTRGRERTFFDGPGAVHVSAAEPFCPELRQAALSGSRELVGRPAGTYLCIEGPRFSTAAESRLFRQWGADVIGMTLAPECVLAREAEICYLAVATVTDWDVWKERPVSSEAVVRTMKENEGKVRELLSRTIPAISQERGCNCKDALKDARI